MIAARTHDPSGRLGSGVAGGGNLESRLFRTGSTGFEPTLGVTRNGWIFYAAAGLETQVLRSRDGGVTWEALFARVTADPYLWVDPATDRIFTVDFDGCGLLSYSDDHGDTWQGPTAVTCGHTNDHQTIYAGPPVSGTTNGYPNVLYYCAIGGGALANASTVTACSRSYDGGLTFAPTPALPFGPVIAEKETLTRPCDGASGQIFVDAAGTLYVPRGVCGQPWLAISRDEGASWTQVQVADNGMGRMASGDWDHEAAVRADGWGNVFYSWVARDRVPYLAVSHDNGTTWSHPIRVAPEGVGEADLPNMDLDEGGRLALVYMGTTHSPVMPFPNDGGCTPRDNPDRYASYITDPNASECHPPEAVAAYEHVTWNAYITLTDDPLAASPRFVTAPINDPADPLVVGECGPFRCVSEDFLDVDFGPRGEIVAAVIDHCDPTGTCDYTGEAVLGKLVRPNDDRSTEFVADGAVAYSFVPDPVRVTGVSSPEGCETEPGQPIGLLAGVLPASPCHSGNWGFATSYSTYSLAAVTANASPVAPATFTSEPFDRDTYVGGPGSVVVHFAEPLNGPLHDAEPDQFYTRVLYRLDVVSANGATRLATSGEAVPLVVAEGRQAGTFEVRPFQVLAGERVRVELQLTGTQTSDARMLFGGGDYADSGLTLAFGHLRDAKPEPRPVTVPEPATPKAEAEAAAGSLGWLSLLPLLLGARCRRPRVPAESAWSRNAGCHIDE